MRDAEETQAVRGGVGQIYMTTKRLIMFGSRLGEQSMAARHELPGKTGEQITPAENVLFTSTMTLKSRLGHLHVF